MRITGIGVINCTVTIGTKVGRVLRMRSLDAPIWDTVSDDGTKGSDMVSLFQIAPTMQKTIS